jgi:hypothetical protein
VVFLRSDFRKSGGAITLQATQIPGLVTALGEQFSKAEANEKVSLEKPPRPFK